MRVPVLTDGVVVLDMLRPDDAEAIVAADNEKARWAFGDTAPMTMRGAARLIERAAAKWARESSWRWFAIRRTGNPGYIGRLLLRARLPRYTIEIALAPEYQNQRLGRKAVMLACGYAFEELHAEAVEGHVRAGNVESGRMLTAVGFEGERGSGGAVDRKGHPTGVGVMTADHWRQIANLPA